VRQEVRERVHTATNGQRSTLAFLAGELRRARGAAGLSQGQLAEAISYSESLVAMVETGRRTPSKDFTGRCDEALTTGGLLTRILHDVVSREFAPEWLRPWHPLEREATALRTYQPAFVPGLLQTPDYARAVLADGGLATDEEREQHLVTRLARQAILNRPGRPQFIAVLDEMVLRRAIGGAKVMHEQLRYLRDAARDGLVRIQVVPLTVGMYPGLNGPFVLATLAGDGDVVYLDDAIRGHVVESPSEVAYIRRVWDDVRCEALPHSRSMELIGEAADSWSQ
jgi:transcriptional regulator with XRE-family HTH domain